MSLLTHSGIGNRVPGEGHQAPFDHGDSKVLRCGLQLYSIMKHGRTIVCNIYCYIIVNCLIITMWMMIQRTIQLTVILV